MSRYRHVKPGKLYRFDPVPIDIYDAKTKLAKGDIVRVVNLAGCPKANTMGHCHVEKDGRFAGLVCTNSLEELKP